MFAFGTQGGCGSILIARPLRILVTNARSLGGESAGLPVESRTREGKLTTIKGKKFPDFDTAYRKRGTGGRSSYNGITATIFGGSGLVGRSLMGRLGKTGTQIVMTYRGSRYDEEKFKIAGDLGQIYFSKIDLKNDESLYEAMRYSNVVINLIGKRHPTSNFSFEDVHVDGPRRIAKIARELGIKKLIHLSAINAQPNPKPVVLKKGSEFLKSKYYGELAVREEFPEAIIMRPSDIIGERDSFITHFTSFVRTKAMRKLTIWDYYHEVEKQPVYVLDIVDAIDKAIQNDSANGKTFQAVGPYRYDFYELIDYMLHCSGRDRAEGHTIENLRFDPVMRAMITISGMIQKYPFCTWDRIETESISDFIDPDLPTIEDLGVELTQLEPIIQWLGFYIPRHHRVEIPYESALKFDLPRRLNEISPQKEAAAA